MRAPSDDAHDAAAEWKVVRRSVSLEKAVCAATTVNAATGAARASRTGFSATKMGLTPAAGALRTLSAAATHRVL